jgi:hypothetical protein
MDEIALWMRKPWHIMIKTEDFDDFKLCVGLVERTDNFCRMYSGGGFIIEHRIHADARPTDDEVKTLKAVLHRHIWAMKNTGQVTLRGLRKPDKESRIRRHVTDEHINLCTEDEYDIESLRVCHGERDAIVDAEDVALDADDDALDAEEEADEALDEAAEALELADADAVVAVAASTNNAQLALFALELIG